MKLVIENSYQENFWRRRIWGHNCFPLKRPI